MCKKLSNIVRIICKDNKKLNYYFLLSLHIILTILLRVRLVRVKWLTGKYFPENDLRENILRKIFYGKIFSIVWMILCKTFSEKYTQAI